MKEWMVYGRNIETGEKDSVSLEAETIGQATILGDKMLNDVSQVVEIERDKSKVCDLSRPQLIENPDLTALKANCEAVMDEIEKEGYSDEDNPHYVYEVAMKTLYGDNVFDYINAKCR